MLLTFSPSPPPNAGWSTVWPSDTLRACAWRERSIGDDCAESGSVVESSLAREVAKLDDDGHVLGQESTAEPGRLPNKHIEMFCPSKEAIP